MLVVMRLLFGARITTAGVAIAEDPEKKVRNDRTTREEREKQETTDEYRLAHHCHLRTRVFVVRKDDGPVDFEIEWIGDDQPSITEIPRMRQ